MKTLVLPAGFLVFLSLVMLSSIAPSVFWNQFSWMLVGVGILISVTFFDWRFFLNSPWFVRSFYALALLLLLAVFFVGLEVRSVKSWLSFGSLRFQPVELMKVALILIYAQYFSRKHLEIARWPIIFVSALLAAVPIGLVALQPDLGSALILGAIWVSFLMVSGLPRRRLLALFFLFLVGLAFAWQYGLKDYQKERILNVFYPERNARTFNFNVIQSKIAIGSAGWWGKGYGQGSQTQAGFLPEASNDFMFAALIEEWGWLVGFLALFAYFWLLFQILRVGKNAQYNFERYVCLGTALMLLVQFFLNVGSVLGISPVIGVTFPFLSYGGSSLVTSFFLLSFIYGIALRS